MKKPLLWILLLVTCIFGSFTAGFFAGRNLNRAPVRIYQVTAPIDPTPTESSDTSESSNPTVPLLVNINTATVEELEALPGIGPTLAQRILDYRTENGPFPSPESLMNVKGIGESRLAALLDLITID